VGPPLPRSRRSGPPRSILGAPAYSHVYFDISWDKVANYAVESDESAQRVAGIINRNPDRVLFGTDCVAPSRQQQMLDVFNLYDPVWRLLTPEASRKVRLENHERIFDEAKRRTRAWEHANVRRLSGPHARPA